MKPIRIVFTLVLFGALFYAPQLLSETTYLTSYLANTFFKNNLHEVEPGKFYRSAQMSNQDLAETIQKYKIKTVIDLRAGKDEGENGVKEAEVVESKDARYVSFPLVGSRVPKRETVESLLNIYREATPPILVHCSSGTHRSGVASALWLMDREGQPVETAKEQLSTKYGFFRWERALKGIFVGHPTIDALIWQYEQDHKATGVDFKTWISTQLK